MMEIVIAVMLAVGVAVVGLLVQEIRKQSRSPRSHSSSGHRPRNPFQPSTIPSPVMARLQGDRAAAERLYAHVKRNHPGQPERWIWDKVIFDLERDRL